MKALLLTLCLGFASCDAMNFATPDQKAIIAAYDVQLAEKDAALDALEADFADMKLMLSDAARAGDMEQLSGLQSAFLTMLAEYKSLESDRLETSEAQQEVIDEVMKGQNDALFTFGNMNIPDGPWKGPLLGGLYLLSRTATKRGRRHMGNAVKNAAKLRLGALIADVGNALGYGSGSPDMALASAVDAANKHGDEKLSQPLSDALARRAEARAEGLPVQGIPVPVTMPPNGEQSTESGGTEAE